MTVAARPIARADYSAWRPLWDGYNAFYGRSGTTALPEETTATLWNRFFDPVEPVFGCIAEDQRSHRVVGIVHYLFHRSTSRIEPVCYLQDLFTDPQFRGNGIGRLLIQQVGVEARLAGAKRVYWQTQTSNEAGRRLYDKVAQHLGFIVYSQDLA